MIFRTSLVALALLASLFTGCSNCLCAQPPALLPFPQATRSRWLNPPVDSQADLNRECLRGWETILKKLVVTDGCEPGEVRVVVDVSDFGGSIRPTYSEGIGWGMLFAAIIRLYGLLVASGNFPDIPAWLQSHLLPREILKPALAQ